MKNTIIVANVNHYYVFPKIGMKSWHPQTLQKGERGKVQIWKILRNLLISGKFYFRTLCKPTHVKLQALTYHRLLKSQWTFDPFSPLTHFLEKQISHRPLCEYVNPSVQQVRKVEQHEQSFVQHFGFISKEHAIEEIHQVGKHHENKKGENQKHADIKVTRLEDLEHTDRTCSTSGAS